MHRDASRFRRRPLRCLIDAPGLCRVAAMVMAGALLSAAAPAATRSYIVTDFDSLRVDAPIDVAVATGRGISAQGEGDRDLLDRIDLTVSARVLTVRLKPSSYEGRRHATAGAARLNLTVPGLRRVQLTGAGSLQATGLNRSRAEIIAAGNGHLAIAGVDSDVLDVTQLGSGSVTLAGKARSLTMRVSGAGALDASALTVADLDVRLDGSASVAARADRAAHVVAIGPGGVTVTGKGACTVNHAGSGTVSCGGASY